MNASPDCKGSHMCASQPHVHGCWADEGDCDDPGEHVTQSLGYWAISGEAFKEAMQRANAGEDPDLLYAEFYANSVIEKVAALPPLYWYVGCDACEEVSGFVDTQIAAADWADQHINERHEND